MGKLHHRAAVLLGAIAVQSMALPAAAAAVDIFAGNALVAASDDNTCQRRGGGGGGQRAAGAPRGGGGGGQRAAAAQHGGGGARNVRTNASSNINHSGNRNYNGNVNANRNINANRNVNVNNNVNVNRNVNVDNDWYGGRDDHWHPIATAAAVTATAMVVGSVVRSIPPSCTTVYANGVTYSQCGGTYYQPRYVGSSVEYVVVGSPY